MTAQSADDNKRFGDRYAASGVGGALAAEFEALGSDYQANGYTTIEQADALGRALKLGPGQLLIDVGSGCGWPGLYLASKHGCAVVSIDPVAQGLRVAEKRSRRDGLDGRSWNVHGNANALPFRPGSADAMVHTDVMC